MHAHPHQFNFSHRPPVSSTGSNTTQIPSNIAYSGRQQTNLHFNLHPSERPGEAVPPSAEVDRSTHPPVPKDSRVCTESPQAPEARRPRSRSSGAHKSTQSHPQNPIRVARLVHLSLACGMSHFPSITSSVSHAAPIRTHNPRLLVQGLNSTFSTPAPIHLTSHTSRTTIRSVSPRRLRPFLFSNFPTSRNWLRPRVESCMLRRLLQSHLRSLGATHSLHRPDRGKRATGLI